MNMRDLAPTTRAVKQAIRSAMKHRPTSSEAPDIPHAIARERAFLAHCRDEEFDRDLERYRLHMKQGLSFRQIALLEVAKKMGKPLTPDAVPRTIRKEVSGESSVREAVHSLYKAANLQTYKARRRRIETPGQGAEPYKCDQHGPKATESLPQMAEGKSDTPRRPASVDHVVRSEQLSDLIASGLVSCRPGKSASAYLLDATLE